MRPACAQGLKSWDRVQWRFRAKSNRSFLRWAARCAQVSVGDDSKLKCKIKIITCTKHLLLLQSVCDSRTNDSFELEWISQSDSWLIWITNLHCCCVWFGLEFEEVCLLFGLQFSLWRVVKDKHYKFSGSLRYFIKIIHSFYTSGWMKWILCADGWYKADRSLYEIILISFN